jgi:non-reducing end alpha-L-arabinofuranosidase
MNRSFLVAVVVLGLPFAACGGTTSIGEGGDSGTGGQSASGGTGAAGTSGSSGTGSGEGGTSSGGTSSGGTSSGGTSNGGTSNGGSSSGGPSRGGAAPGTGGTSGSSGTGVSLPCDVLEAGGVRCVAAHSTVRALVSGYDGYLYQVQVPDGSTLDIGHIYGHVDIETHDRYCAGRSCVVSIIYDQTPNGHHLTPSPPGSAKPTRGKPATIGDLFVTVAHHAAYGLRFRPGEGYRAACSECDYPTGPVQTALDDEPQTIYMVTSQHDLVNGCCFDYGNGEWNSANGGNGTAEALYVGKGVIWGTGVDGGPWVMADLENGLYAGWENGQDRNISTNTPVLHDFVTAVLVGDTADKNGGKGRFALYGGDATQGSLKTMYDGIRPETPDYVPMHKEGSIILSIAGDNSDFDGGRFYEGVIANGAASPETVDALQAAIVGAGYGR